MLAPLNSPETAVDEARIKGAGVREFLRWYASHHGAERLAEMARSLPETYRRYFRIDEADLGVLPAAWIPARAVHALLDRLTAGLSRAEIAELARGGAESAIDATLRGVYSFLFRTMMTPQRYARRAQRLFSRYYSSGVMVKTEISPTSHLSIIRDWSGHHRFLCQLILYTAVYVYEALGCRDVEVERIGCVDDGDPHCSFIIRWKA